MTSGLLRTVTPTLDIYIKLAQFPILADKIRARMRQTIFDSKVISEDKFEGEVEALAIASQKREGVFDPFNQEPATTWQRRKNRIREFHTDFYFGNNFTTQQFEELVERVVGEYAPEERRENTSQMNFNPELAPWEMLFRQGEVYEQMPPQEQAKYSHHLQEIKVVLIKGMISDQLKYIGVAKNILTIDDLRRIYARRIGGGKIGGKAAGMLLAWKILKMHDTEFGPDISDNIQIPDSYFLGTDVLYDFRKANGLDEYMNQKYLPIDQIREQHEVIIQKHIDGHFPEEIRLDLRGLLETIGDRPLIVRSSSLLEDNFGYAFAGKYNSYFCPNQGTLDQNLEHLLHNIKLVYASTGNPDALLYRKDHGLIDYDERMAILIQRVRGEQHGRYFFPTLAGVGFSQNPYRWHSKIRREDGFLRIVLGMGTRAVDRVVRDYPRLIALSHPTLRPETSAKAIRAYSQRQMDVIDLDKNSLETIPVSDVLTADFPLLRYVASIDQGGYLQSFVAAPSIENDEDVVLTFDYLTRDQKFTKLLRTALMRLERHYKTPVDIEFTIEIIPTYPYPEYKLHLLQCRPLSQRESGPVEIPADIPEEDVVFRSHHLVPNGSVQGIRYIIFVDPVKYYAIGDVNIRHALGRVIGRLNQSLEDQDFITMGPGRWGSANIELGVRVSYADVHNTKVLIEISVANEQGVPELSYGTHFFQDLVEAGIYSLPLHLETPKSQFKWEFFRESPSRLAELAPKDAELEPYIRVIDLASMPGSPRLTILMDGETDEAVGFLEHGDWTRSDVGGHVGTF